MTSTTETSTTEWQERVKAYKQSSLPRGSWCKAQGIAPSTFQYHLNKEKSKEKKAKFTELKPTSQGIKLHWRNITLELEADFDERTLERFLKVLR